MRSVSWHAVLKLTHQKICEKRDARNRSRFSHQASLFLIRALFFGGGGVGGGAGVVPLLSERLEDDNATVV